MCFLKNMINDMKLYWFVKNDKYMFVVILYCFILKLYDFIFYRLGKCRELVV